MVSEISPLAQRAATARDLKRQLAELSDYDEQEIIFRETSPARQKVRIYSAEDGSPVDVFKYRVEFYMNQRMSDGRARFQADPSLVPAWHQGQVRCFMATDSPEREVLTSIGIHKICPAVHLPNDFAKLEHARKKHKAEWSAYQAFVTANEQRQDREIRQQEVAAIQAIARQAVGASRPGDVQEVSSPQEGKVKANG